MRTQFTSRIVFVLAGLVAAGLIGFVGMSSVAYAADATPAAKKGSTTTQMNFEDLLVQGKYHFSDEAVVTVEEDKVLDALLGVRTDFKDRVKKSSARY